MKKIRIWMYIGVAILIFDLHIGGINLLSRFLGYIVLTGCVRALEKTENRWQMTLLGGTLTVYSLVFSLAEIQATVALWSACVVYMTLDMLLFYGIATLLYQKRQEDYILLRRRNLMMIRTVSIIAFCLQLNLPAVGVVRMISEGIYLLYLLLAILPLCKEKAQTAEEAGQELVS